MSKAHGEGGIDGTSWCRSTKMQTVGRRIDIVEDMNFSKPSVSVAMKKLRENGYISMSSDNLISLTDKGYAIARKIYDRHQALTKYLIQIGVPEEIARDYSLPTAFRAFQKKISGV